MAPLIIQIRMVDAPRVLRVSAPPILHRRQRGARPDGMWARAQTQTGRDGAGLAGTASNTRLVCAQNGELAAEELKRCVRDLGMAGVQIGSHVNDWNLSAKQLEPLFAVRPAVSPPPSPKLLSSSRTSKLLSMSTCLRASVSGFVRVSSACALFVSRRPSRSARLCSCTRGTWRARARRASSGSRGSWACRPRPQWRSRVSRSAACSRDTRASASASHTVPPFASVPLPSLPPPLPSTLPLPLPRGSFSTARSFFHANSNLISAPTRSVPSRSVSFAQIPSLLECI